MPVTTLDLMIPSSHTPYWPTFRYGYTLCWARATAHVHRTRRVQPLDGRALRDRTCDFLFLADSDATARAGPVHVLSLRGAPRLDKTGNACPSMHMAVAIFTLGRVDDVLRLTRSPLGCD